MFREKYPVLKVTLGLPGASEAEAGRVHLHEPSEHGDLDVCRVCLHRSQHCAFSCQQVPSISLDLLFCVTRL